MNIFYEFVKAKFIDDAKDLFSPMTGFKKKIKATK